MIHLILPFFLLITGVRSTLIPKTSKQRLIDNQAPYTAAATLFSVASISSLIPQRVYAGSADDIDVTPLNLKNFPQSSLSSRCFSTSIEDSTTLRSGITSPDVYYPSYFNGKWFSTSKAVSVLAPLGEDIFGLAAYKAAEKDIGTVLNYVSKFKPDLQQNSEFSIADRLYNVESIAQASMGENSVVDDKQNSQLTKLLHLTVAPNGSNGQSFDINLVPTDRLYSTPSMTSMKGDYFECMEQSTQEVLAVVPKEVELTSGRPPALRKDVETITLYKKVSDDLIIAKQRTATYLSSKDPRFKLALARDPRVKDVAVDVRLYDVTYKRI